MLCVFAMLAAAFMRKLSDTIFQMVAADVEEVRRFHTSNNKHAMGKEALDKKGPQYWASVTRRMMLEATALKAALDLLWKEFGGSEGLDPVSGEHLFTQLTWDVLQAIYKLIDDGNFCGEACGAVTGGCQSQGSCVRYQHSPCRSPASPASLASPASPLVPLCWHCLADNLSPFHPVITWGTCS